MFGMAWIRKWTPQNTKKICWLKLKAQDSTFSILVVQGHIESIGKPILSRGARCRLMSFLLKVLSDMLQSPQLLSHIHICPNQKSNSAPPKPSIQHHQVLLT